MDLKERDYLGGIGAGAWGTGGSYDTGDDDDFGDDDFSWG